MSTAKAATHAIPEAKAKAKPKAAARLLKRTATEQEFSGGRGEGRTERRRGQRGRRGSKKLPLAPPVRLPSPAPRRGARARAMYARRARGSALEKRAVAEPVRWSKEGGGGPK